MFIDYRFFYLIIFPKFEVNVTCMKINVTYMNAVNNCISIDLSFLKSICEVLFF